MRTLPLLLAGALTLGACQTTGNLENDMLPSREVTAFHKTDARLGYADARIGYDGANCALYTAIGPDGRPYSETLRDASGARICTN